MHRNSERLHRRSKDSEVYEKKFRNVFRFLSDSLDKMFTIIKNYQTLQIYPLKTKTDESELNTSFIEIKLVVSKSISKKKNNYTCLHVSNKEKCRGQVIS